MTAAGTGRGTGAGAGVPAGALVGQVDGVLLDVDDTLVDTRSAFAAAVDAVCRQWLPHLDADGRAAALALWRADPEGHYRAYTRGETDADTQRRRRAEGLQAAFGGARLGDTGYAAWVEVFWSTFEDAWSAHADAVPLLATLRAAGLPSGAVTNADAALQTRKLARCGLGEVDVLVTLDTLGVGKPDPRVFHEGCRRLGTAPARTLYVGDEADVDALAAVAAGLVGVWLDRPGERRGGPAHEDPDAVREQGAHVVRSLTELGALLGGG
ncbi:HAD family hydrolase [Cellulomonas marina]|uniref:Putative hydrolase of the HAD superfamily n=1 Tax=Cellulomonas marina TaxID=988821 RepID=A0A1I0YN46_9CELL|nr:HAD family hydrolase [Cellulomonas marina]GIG27619.1 haloacid dehalogenase [Cellulomonas marina]SFB14754.1 putative hydrolase of the HAD superfamily [Cellulomonas marina]